jgi:hypothetical protein
LRCQWGLLVLLLVRGLLQCARSLLLLLLLLERWVLFVLAMQWCS